MLAELNSPLGLLELDQARREDLDSVMQILNEAAAWLQNRGIRQWPFPLPQRTWEKIESSIERGHVFLARMLNDQRIIGTLRLEWVDPLYWPLDPTGAGYLHNLATNRGLHGLGLGRTLVAWAARFVRNQDRRFLRLDCGAENTSLCKYYEQLGFVSRGLVVDCNYTAALYELDLFKSPSPINY